MRLRDERMEMETIKMEMFGEKEEPKKQLVIIISGLQR